MTNGDRLDDILAVVESSLEEPDLSARDLAGRAYLSRFHFDRLVRASLGEPLGAFRRRLLLERAAHRLSRSSDPVIDVALGAGYGSPEAFTRAFARAFGKPPTDYRQSGAAIHDLPAPSGVHFHPPAGLRIPALTRSNALDVLTRMFDHHLDLTGRIIDRTAGLDETMLDRTIELSVEGIDENPTLHSLAERLVSQLEMWVNAVQGGTSMPTGEATAAGLRSRLEAVAPRFRELVVAPIEAGQANDTFLDSICEPPETFTYGGVLAHVLTFSAVRRTMAIGALETAGITDLGCGDPMQFVGGFGADASTIERTRQHS